MIECDVLVVGAGPAGSSAARAAALGGAKTIFIDKKREVGVPVQCAEGIGGYLLQYLPFKIPKELLVWKIEGISFWAEDITIERTGSNWSGYSINRDEFDKWLANKAIKAGAKLLLETELIDLEVKEEYNVTKAIVKTPAGNKEIVPKVVIAADGVDSTVLRLLGFKIRLERNCGYVIGYEMRNLKLEKPNYEHVFMGNFAPGGYGYIFPKSRTTANVGVGALFPNRRFEEYYEEFLDLPIVKAQVKDGVKIKEKSGWIPFRYLTDKWVYGNTLLVGDVANQNIKPLVEGFLPAVICGDIAGKTVAHYISNKSILEDYPKGVEQKLGSLFRESDFLLELSYNLLQSKKKEDILLTLGINTNIFSFNDIDELKKETYTLLKSKIMKYGKRGS